MSFGSLLGLAEGGVLAFVIYSCLAIFIAYLVAIVVICGFCVLFSRKLMVEMPDPEETGTRTKLGCLAVVSESQLKEKHSGFDSILKIK